MFTAALVSALVGVAVSLAISLIGAGAKAGATVAIVKGLENIFSIANLDIIKGFDQPYTSIATQAINMLGNFILYARSLVILCAFLCVIFNAFKLWSGTIELKKVFADSIYKAVMVTAIMLVYPTVVNKTYSLATQLGVEASGGYDAVYTSFSNLAKRARDIWEEGSKEYFSIITEGCDKDSDGNYIISEKTLKTFTDSGMSQDEAIAWAKQHGIVVDDVKVSSKSKKTEKKAGKQLSNKSNKEKVNMMKQSLAIIRGLNEVLTGTPDVQLADGTINAAELLSMGEDTLDKIFYNPYIGDSKTLSASAMIKTGIIIADLSSSGCLSPITDSYSEEKNPTMKEINEGDTNVFLKFLSLIFKSFVYKLGMLLAMIFIMCEYILCLIEYLIVAAVSALLIPLFFIDATKQFATNILKIIFSYFIKILVTTMMCFFVLVLYIDLGAEFCSKTDLSSISTILVYVFSLALGIILVKNSGKIAGSVISGNPSMGLGDIANEFRSMTHAMHGAAHVAQAGQKMAQKATQEGQKTWNRGQSIGTSLNAAHGQASQARGELKKDAASGKFNGGNGVIARAGLSAFNKSMMKQGMQSVGDKLHKALTGFDRPHLDADGKNTGFLKVGQEFAAEGGRVRKATAADAKAAADAKLNGDAVGFGAALKKGEKHFVKADKDRAGGDGNNTGNKMQTKEQQNLANKIKAMQDEHS